MKKVEMYVNGLCFNNPGSAGYGIVIHDGERTRELSGGFDLTTNKRIKLLAAIIGLETLHEKCEVDLYCTSSYLVSNINKEKINDRNSDLWKRLSKMTNFHSVTFHLMQKNSRHELSRCDQLAIKAIRTRLLRTDKGFMKDDTRKKRENLYKNAGVNIEKHKKSISSLINLLSESFNFTDYNVLRSIGYFANIIKLNNDLALTVSVDGVGTKILIAQMANKYDTIGVDCVAMNVNDIICVGSKPICFLDYIAVQEIDDNVINQVSTGLLEGARQANVAIVGGETAQIRDMIKGFRDGSGFDLVGFACGIVHPDKIIDGRCIDDDNIIIGISSSGLHSNGYSLVRKVFFERKVYDLSDYIPEFCCTLGEELLKPTYIYVPLINNLISKNIDIKALVNITGGGFLNLLRVQSRTQFIIDNLPEPQPIFSMIQNIGRIDDCEMFRTFNMGIGFCIIIDSSDYDSVADVCNQLKFKHHIIGYTKRSDDKYIDIIYKNKEIRGQGSLFRKI